MGIAVHWRTYLRKKYFQTNQGKYHELVSKGMTGKKYWEKNNEKVAKKWWKSGKKSNENMAKKIWKKWHTWSSSPTCSPGRRGAHRSPDILSCHLIGATGPSYLWPPTLLTMYLTERKILSKTFNILGSFCLAAPLCRSHRFTTLKCKFSQSNKIQQPWLHFQQHQPLWELAVKSHKISTLKKGQKVLKK